MDLTLKETRLNPIQIMINELPIGFDHFKTTIGRVLGEKLTSIQAQAAKRSYMQLCAFNQLVFINTKTLPVKICKHPSIYMHCSGSYIRFIRELKNTLGFWPRQIYKNQYYNIWLYATKCNRFSEQISEGARTVKKQDCWNKCGTVLELKAFMLGMVTTNETNINNMAQFTNFDRLKTKESNKRILQADLLNIKKLLKAGKITQGAATILKGAAHKAQAMRKSDLDKDTKTYIKCVKTDFIRTFGKALKDQHENSAVTTNLNAKGKARIDNSKPRFSANGLEIINEVKNGKDTGKEIYKLNKTVMKVVNSKRIKSNQVGS